MVLEQAALTHDIERIFRSKKSEKTFQNDEGAKQHMAPSTIDITSSLDICAGGLLPHRHKEGHIRQLSNWDLGRVRRVKVRPGEGVIALPYEPS